MKLGEFANDEAKSKYMQMRIHWQDPCSSIAKHKKGVAVEVDAKSFESNMLSMFGGSNNSLPFKKKQKNKHKKKQVNRDTTVANQK